MQMRPAVLISWFMRLGVAALALALTAPPAGAVLLDHGPADPTLVFPIWYRDLNGLALKECLSTVPSPNPGAAAKPMCFPLNPDPAGFPGNVGPEIFYNGVTAIVQRGNPNFSLKYIGSLEASYIPAGVPVHGTEAVFARVRVVISTQTVGVYKVTHPFGVDVFNVTAADIGPRAVFFTVDTPFGVTMNFDLALQGRVGPWVQWDFVDPGFTLTNSAGEQFVADPAFNHTFTGSPFGTNFIRVDGPAGSNLDGVGNDFILTPLANVVGQMYLLAIPTPLTIKRATYSRDPVSNVIGVDVFASSAPAQSMILTGAGMPSVKMTGDALGNYFAHVEMPATLVPPTSITVSNTTSVPVNSATQGLIDLVDVTSATFDTLTRVVKATATSSDLLAPGPALTVAGPLGGPMIAGSFIGLPLLPGVLPPSTLTVISAAGGTDVESVTILPGLPDNKPFPPVAVPDAIIGAENTTLPFNATANDAVTPPAVVGSLIVLVPPLSGTAVASAVTPGVITYTPNLNFFGLDSFQYVLIDSTGAVSNVATVSVTINFVAAAPTANPDNFALLKGTSRIYNVVANDTAAAGTTINAASVTLSTLPLHGSAVANLDGTVTYTPTIGYVGADSYAYTVANTAGVASTPSTVSIVVENGPEALAITKASFTVSKNQWNIVGSTNWFGPTLTGTKMTCWIGKGIAVGALIGVAPVDNTGKFSLVPPSLTTPPPDATNIFTCQSSNGGSISALVQRI